jgi:ubiquinone/menaquinone biosynthesis C-methylase UbiE
MLLGRLLRFFFALLYNPLAWTYDLVSWTVSIGQWRRWQQAALPYVPPGPVLEIAHGTGNLLLDLHRAGHTPLGLDLSPAMGRLARRKLRAHGVAVPLLRGQVQALPLASQSFASLIATFPTDFILDPQAVAEFYRVLRPAGRLIIVPVAHITGPALPDRWARWLFRVTAQASEAWLEPLNRLYAPLGFSVRVERATLPRSVVTVIVAEKSA